MPILTQLEDGVLTVTLNRPERLNALSMDMLRALGKAAADAERDPAVKVLVLTGAGRAFSSGADVSEFDFTPPGPPVGDLLRSVINPLILRLRGMDKPTLAAVNGVAAGAGLSLALACDLRYAAASARFVEAFVNIGLVPDAGSLYFLPRLVGSGKALELALLGEAIDAPAALEIGLVNRVVPDEDLVGCVGEVARRLAHGPSKTLGLIKRGLNQAHELPLERVLELEAGYQAVAAALPSFAEGVTAFREKRAPRFEA